MFDPYHKWLAIPKQFRPPTLYQLLGLGDGEDDPEVIEEAAIRQIAHLRTYQMGPQSELCTKLLNELAEAKSTLLNPAKRRAYDEHLAKKKASTTAAEAPVKRNAKASQGKSEFRFDNDVVGIVGTASRKVDVRKPAPKLTPTHWTLIGAGAGIAIVALIIVVLVSSNSSTTPPPANPDVLVVAKKKNPDPEPKKKLPPVIEKKFPVQKKPPIKQPPVEPKKELPIPNKIDPKVNGDLRSFRVKSRPTYLAISPDATKLVAGSVRLTTYDLKTGQDLATFHPTKGGGAIRAPVRFFPDGKRILYAYGSEPVAVIADATTGATLDRLPLTDSQYIDSLAVGPNGKRALAGYNNQLVYWDIESQKPIHTAQTKIIVRKLAITPDGRNAVTAYNPSGRVRYVSVTNWDLDGLKQVGRQNISGTHSVHSLAVSPDGRMVALGTVLKFALMELPGLTVTPFTVPDPANHVAVAFCGKGKLLLCGGKDGVIRLYDISTQRKISEWPGHNDSITQIVVDPNERVAVSGDNGSNMFVWPLSKLDELK